MSQLLKDIVFTNSTDLVAKCLLGREIKGVQFWNMLLQLPMKFSELRVATIDVPFHCFHTYKHLQQNNRETNKTNRTTNNRTTKQNKSIEQNKTNNKTYQ